MSEEGLWFIIKGFRFSNPIFLWLLLLIPIIVWAYKKYYDKKKNIYIKLGVLRKISRIEDHINKNRKKVWMKSLKAHMNFLLVLLAITFLVIALADPQIPLKKAEKGVNVVLAIDTSGSMSATDYKPSRLEAAKKAAEVFIDGLHRNDNIGIVTFSSGVRTLCYLTPFKDRAKEKLESLNKAEGATAIGDGLMLAIDMATSIPNKHKVIILLTDGVNNAGSVSPQEAAEYAKKEGIKVYTVGLGSTRPVLLGYDFFGNPQYAELDEKTLNEIASITGGKYYKSVNEKTLEEIYKNISKNIKRDWVDQSIKDVFLWLALIALLLDIYFVYIKYKIVA